MDNISLFVTRSLCPDFLKAKASAYVAASKSKKRNALSFFPSFRRRSLVMFVKKLVDKASKKPVGNSNSLKVHDVNPRLVFHYGIPARPVSLAYESVQKILAISTKDGQIKLYGKDNTQSLLESKEPVPSKFLQFLENQGILLNVTIQNHVEVWDIDKRQLSHVHVFKEDITSFKALPRSFFMYVGDSLGNVSVLKLEKEPWHLIRMQYNIPFSICYGRTSKVIDDIAVMYALPQPMAESRRVLVIFKDGLIVLWGVQESSVLFVTGGKMVHSLGHELKKVTSACWACPFGSKVVVGYSNGEIFIWGIPVISNPRNIPSTDKEELCASQNLPISKLNLGYKMDKTPILSLRWVPADGKASRLYVNGVSNSGSSNSFQIILLNENTESRMIKLVLPLPEACLDMEIIASNQNKHKQHDLLLLAHSGSLHVYDDSEIEKYLIQSQSRSPPTLPKQVMVRVPFVDSNITAALYITDNSDLTSTADKDQMPVKNFPSLFPSDMKEKDLNHSNSARSGGFTKFKNLYITGHSNGAINFWDTSCPFLLLILSVKQEGEGSHSLSGIPVTALYFDITSRLLVSGDQRGMVRIFKFKPDQSTSGNNLLSLQATTKQGCSTSISSVKLVKVNGAILSLNVNPVSGHLVVGSDEGYVSIVDMEGPTILSQKHFLSELYTGIISLQFENYNIQGNEKSVLMVALKDSSVLALEGDMGTSLSNSMIRSKKPSRALFMQTLDGQQPSTHGTDISEGPGSTLKDAIPKQSLVLICSEKAVYLYSLVHVVQGIKKVVNKKKFHGDTCCWASTFYGPGSDLGLLLLFASGKVEVRSLPDLTILREFSLRGFTFSTFESSLCSSSEGELVVVNRDQEIFFVSVLPRTDIYRHLKSLNQVFNKDSAITENGPTLGPTINKEKKKGIFSAVIKDMKGNKAKKSEGAEAVDPKANTEEELSAIFSTTNFSLNVESRDSLDMHESDDELNIDDIDLEDAKDKPKGQNIITLNKHKLAGKLQAIKGKLKSRKTKTESSLIKEDDEDRKNADALDQIKKRYGYPSSGESGLAKMTESKLKENLGKLQNINSRTTVMQDTARSFSSTAKELLRTAEQERRSS